MPVEQHPIPQDVAGYRFRLIGEMTLKQFAYLAGGIVIGLIIYSLPLPFFFRYPLAAIAICLGAGIAFLPIEGRPMDKWLIAFIKSVYSPTQYVWKKSGTEQEVVGTKVIPPKTTPIGGLPLTKPTPITPSVPSAPAPTPVVPISTPIVTPTPVAQAPVPPKPIAPSQPVSAPTVVSTPVVPAPAPIPKPIAVQPTPAPTPSSKVPPANLPIPFTPSTPNTLVGMTLTPDSKILPNALVEIKSRGISVRATKSNLLGQFLFAKPLENGTYQIFTESPGYNFATYSLDLTGQIVRPLKLQALSTK